MQQIDELKSLIDVQSLRVATLQASQASRDIERREALAAVAGWIDSGEEPPWRAEGATGALTAGVLSPSSPAAARRPVSPTRRGAHPAWVTAAAHQQRLDDEARQQRFEAYMQRLVAEQDAQGTVVESYAATARARLQRPTDGSECARELCSWCGGEGARYEGADAARRAAQPEPKEPNVVPRPAV